jgi:nicotinate-nucleotide--dimethylbenzimidazole phosphoribosyltransferase
MAVPLLRAAAGMLIEMADLSDVMAGTLKPWPRPASKTD